MLTSRTFKKIGSTLFTASLLFAASCSTDGQEAAAPADPEASAVSAETSAADAATTETSAAPDVDFSQLLDGVTYKGQQVLAISQEGIEDYIRQARETEVDYDAQFDPPECAEAFESNAEDYDPEKLSLETMTIGDLQTDGFSLVAFSSDALKDGIDATWDPSDFSKCQQYSYTAPGLGTMHVSIEELPFEGNVENGYAIIQRIEDDGSGLEPLDVYNTVAVKNGAQVNVNLTVVTDENIAAANETLNMVLDRL